MDRSQGSTHTIVISLVHLLIFFFAVEVRAVHWFSPMHFLHSSNSPDHGEVPEEQRADMRHSAFPSAVNILASLLGQEWPPQLCPFQDGMNCHSPEAPEGFLAVGCQFDSIHATHIVCFVRWKVLVTPWRLNKSFISLQESALAVTFNSPVDAAALATPSAISNVLRIASKWYAQSSPASFDKHKQPDPRLEQPVHTRFVIKYVLIDKLRFLRGSAAPRLGPSPRVTTKINTLHAQVKSV